MTRRQLLASTAAATVASAARAQDQPLDLHALRALGSVAARPSRGIAASPLSVGFETLDRRLFDPARVYPHLAELGVKWARCQTGWARTETKAGVYDFAWLDGVVDSLRAIGIQPWFNVGYGNRLYTPQADQAAVGWAPVFDPTAKAAWLRYVAALATRYAGRVRHFEIWNEPNITGFWKPGQPDARAYVELVRDTAAVFRRLVPQAVIVGPGYAGVPKPSGWFQECLDLGLADLLDKVSYHPYRPVPEKGYAKELETLRAALNQRRPGLGLWQGENGCPSAPGGAGALADLAWTEDRQARWLLRRIVVDLSLGVELTSYFLAVDLVGYGRTSAGPAKTNLKGLLRGTDYTRKPSFDAYQGLCALFDAETVLTAPTLRVEASDGQTATTASFQRGGRPLVAFWAPVSLFEPLAPQQVRVTAPVGPTLADPVLIDPLTRRVLALPGAGPWTLPLRDYPLLITDRAVALP